MLTKRINQVIYVMVVLLIAMCALVVPVFLQYLGSFAGNSHFNGNCSP